MIGALFIVVLMLIKFTSLFSFGVKSEGTYGDEYEEEIDVENNKMPIQILFYGEDVCFRDGVKYNKISNTSNETLKSDKNHTVLIISDLTGNLIVIDTEMNCIKEKV